MKNGYFMKQFLPIYIVFVYIQCIISGQRFIFPNFIRSHRRYYLFLYAAAVRLLNV